MQHGSVFAVFAFLTLADVSSCFSLRDTVSQLLPPNLKASVGSYKPVYASVVFRHGTYSVTTDKTDDCVGHGYYVDSSKTISGFGQLWLTTSSSYSDVQQMHAAGLLEGWLSAERMWHHFHNVQDHFRRSSNVTDFTAAYEWLDQHYDWLQKELRHRTTDGGDGPDSGDRGLWQYVNLLHAQFLGLVEGYDRKVQQVNDTTRLPPLTRRDLLMLSSVGDFDDILAVTNAEQVKQTRRWSDMDAHELSMNLAVRGKCSAIVKVTGDLSDILMSHSAWYTYSGMLRIYKNYDFHLHDPNVASKHMSFSSYPGELSSDDDFYILSSGLVVLQTTNDVHNTSMYTHATPKAFLSWQRVRTACALSTTGEEWGELVSVHNSGTYNNQYMVINLNLFQPGAELKKGLLWVVEQAPGMSLQDDRTSTLERSYWPSYNVPYFPEMYHDMGYEEVQHNQSSRGDTFHKAVMGLNYQLAPRAKMFRRDHGTARDIDSLKQLMRSNSWSTDPYAEHRPLAAICGRGDLDPRLPKAYGCTDTKATNYRMALELRAEAINGPTTEGGLPPFKWSDSFQEARLGHPPAFDNTFEVMESDINKLGFDRM